MRNNGVIIILLLCTVIFLLSDFSIMDNEKPHPYDFKYPEGFGTPLLSPDNPLTEEGVWLGRLLFYDSILSINHKMSCASCHRQELSFTDGRPLAIGTFGDTLTRNTMGLVNLAWSEIFFWDGRVKTMEEVINQPILAKKEMGGLTERELIIRLEQHPYYPTLFKMAFPNEQISMKTLSKAVAQFLYTIVSGFPQTPEPIKGNGNKVYNSKGQRNLKDLLEEDSHEGTVARITAMQCKSCHTTDLYGGKLMTVYEDDSIFKTPSLTNARFTAPYMHDGRFKTAREVLQFYNDSTESILAKNPNLIYEKNDMRTKVKFTKYDLEHADEALMELEDTSVLVNPSYANPFSEKGFSWYRIKK